MLDHVILVTSASTTHDLPWGDEQIVIRTPPKSPTRRDYNNNQQ